MFVPSVNCDNVSFSFPGRVILDNLNLSIAPGTLACITGPNGSGKTTLLKLLSGLILPSAGIVRIGPWSTQRNWRKARGCIGVSIYPERSYNFRLTGYQNAEYAAALAGLTPSAGRGRAQDIVSAFDVAPVFTPRFSDLSLGQRRIFGIMMAILTSGGIVMLDEPTATLDESNREAVVSLLIALRDSGYTVVTTTHDPNLILVADGVISVEEFRS